MTDLELLNLHSLLLKMKADCENSGICSNCENVSLCPFAFSQSSAPWAYLDAVSKEEAVTTAMGAVKEIKPCG